MKKFLILLLVPSIGFAQPRIIRDVPKELIRVNQEPEKKIPVNRTSAPPLLVTQEIHDLYKSFLPRTDDEAFESFRKSDLIFYELEPMYQVWDKGNKSGKRLVSNVQKTANSEFPWQHTAGTDETTKIIRVVHLKGIKWWKQVLNNGTFNGFRWEYEPGTIFAEILLLDCPDQYNRAFEVRTRTKSESGNWRPDVFRPYPEEKNLVATLEKMGLKYPETKGTFFTKSSVNIRESDKRAVRGLVKLSANFVDVVPMKPDLVMKLMTNPVFHSTKGLKWREDSFAPSSSTSFSIVPRNYEGAFLRPSTESCMRCHRDAGKVVVEPGDERWRIRGDDAIFSFHPFDPESRELRLNPKLVSNGLLEHKEGMP